MFHEVHEAAHRVILGGIVGNPGAAQEVADVLVPPDPDRKHRLGRAAIFHTVLADHGGYGRGNVVSRRDRGLDVHHQDRIIARIGQQRFQRSGVTLGAGVTNDVDGI